MPTDDPKNLLGRIRSQNARAIMALRARDDLIRQARREGATLREIASAADLSHAGVAKICDR